MLSVARRNVSLEIPGQSHDLEPRIPRGDRVIVEAGGVNQIKLRLAVMPA